MRTREKREESWKVPALRLCLCVYVGERECVCVYVCGGTVEDVVRGKGRRLAFDIAPSS